MYQALCGASLASTYHVLSLCGKLGITCSHYLIC